MQTTEKSRHGDFYPEVHLVATKLIPVETSSKVAADPLASGDCQVILSHVECSHRALAHDPAEPLVALHVSLNSSCSSRLPRGEHNTPHNLFSGAPHNLLAGFNGASCHQAVLEVATSKSNKHTDLQ